MDPHEPCTTNKTYAKISITIVAAQSIIFILLSFNPNLLACVT